MRKKCFDFVSHVCKHDRSVHPDAHPLGHRRVRKAFPFCGDPDHPSMWNLWTDFGKVTEYAVMKLVHWMDHHHSPCPAKHLRGKPAPPATPPLKRHGVGGESHRFRAHPEDGTLHPTYSANHEHELYAEQKRRDAQRRRLEATKEDL